MENGGRRLDTNELKRAIARDIRRSDKKHMGKGWSLYPAIIERKKSRMISISSKKFVPLSPHLNANGPVA